MTTSPTNKTYENENFIQVPFRDYIWDNVGEYLKILKNEFKCSIKFYYYIDCTLVNKKHTLYIYKK